MNDPSLINLSILVTHQIPMKYGGYIDVLGVDVEGRIHVIELIGIGRSERSSPRSSTMARGLRT